MTKSLYEDALADANRLKALAEETAKNKLVETIMPQIRAMVNQRIMGEQMGLEELTGVVADNMADDGENTVNGDLNGPVINIDADGDVNIEMESEDGIRRRNKFRLKTDPSQDGIRIWKPESEPRRDSRSPMGPPPPPALPTASKSPKSGF